MVDIAPMGTYLYRICIRDSKGKGLDFDSD